MKKSLATLLLLFLCTALRAQYCPLDEEKGVTFALNSPTYTDGELTTCEGGIVSGPDFRVQARCISFTHHEDKENPESRIIAEGDLIIEYGQYIFVGDKIEYDFVTKTGRIYNGRSMLEPWYFGGQLILLNPDMSVVMIEGYLTTSDNIHPEWGIYAGYAHVSKDHLLTAKNVQFRFFQTPALWIPRIRTNLDMILDSPIRYRIRWGGKQGVRFGMLYELFTWRKIKTFLRFDYRVERGPGGGFESHYESSDHKKRFHTINYIARDSSVDQPSQRTRYRFEGLYHNTWDCDRTSLLISYDKLSDEDMATDYQDKGLTIKDAYRTQFNFRRQFQEAFVSNFYSQLRVNNFETVKQELPSFTVFLKPWKIGRTGILSDGMMKIGYVDFVYSEDDTGVSDYNSSRFEFRKRFYRPFHFCYFTFTPQAAGTAIFYNNSPLRKAQWVTLGNLGAEIKTQAYRIYPLCKHLVEPYINYQYYSFPSSTPDEHYIFDINDGLFQLNLLKFGMRNLIYKKTDGCLVIPYLTFDAYTYAFLDNSTQKKNIPRAYASLEWSPTPYWSTLVESSFDFEREDIDYTNVRTEFTLSENLAFSAEYRQRNPFSWRKVNHENFFLESFRNETALRNSLLSDERNTVLCHFFYRPEPNWAAEFQIRHGWNRQDEPSYTEYQFNLFTSLRSQWKMRLSYENRENDHRFAVYFTLGHPVNPDTSKVFLSNPY